MSDKKRLVDGYDVEYNTLSQTLDRSRCVMVLMLNMDTAMFFSILTELQMYTLLVTLMLKAELVASMIFTG